MHTLKQKQCTLGGEDYAGMDVFEEGGGGNVLTNENNTGSFETSSAGRGFTGGAGRGCRSKRTHI
jgi:hypothetical protein